uniref:Uncharacterized protein n=1 Tax=Aegilops tauschii subsp. strangulata TaxID=200361 RepID=A0A453JG17_AEGTS
MFFICVDTWLLLTFMDELMELTLACQLQIKFGVIFFAVRQELQIMVPLNRRSNLA